MIEEDMIEKMYSCVKRNDEEAPASGRTSEGSSTKGRNESSTKEVLQVS